LITPQKPTLSSSLLSLFFTILFSPKLTVSKRRSRVQIYPPKTDSFLFTPLSFLYYPLQSKAQRNQKAQPSPNLSTKNRLFPLHSSLFFLLSSSIQSAAYPKGAAESKFIPPKTDSFLFTHLSFLYYPLQSKAQRIQKAQPSPNGLSPYPNLTSPNQTLHQFIRSFCIILYFYNCE